MKVRFAGGDSIYVFGQQRCTHCGRIDWLYYPLLDLGMECEHCGEMASYPIGAAYSIDHARVDARASVETSAFVSYRKYWQNYN